MKSLTVAAIATLALFGASVVGALDSSTAAASPWAKIQEYCYIQDQQDFTYYTASHDWTGTTKCWRDGTGPVR